MTELDKIQELIKLLGGDVKYIVAKTWNNEDFFKFCYLILKESCEAAVNNSPSTTTKELQMSILLSMELSIPHFAELIKTLLRQTDRGSINLKKGEQLFQFRFT